MKTQHFIKWSAPLALLAAISWSQAAETTLKVGDRAPKIQNGKWIQGGPVKEFSKDKVYLVEFWATWCGPCKVSIPHLNEIHKKFKDQGLVVIGQDCWERDDAAVAPFVEKMGEKMTYCVALDDKEDKDKGKMAETWMEAAGQNGIPSAFLVDKSGIIVWIGHPMGLKEEVIEQVIAGKYDIGKAKEDAANERKSQAKAEENQREIGKIFQQVRSAMQKEDWDGATDKLDEMEKMMPEGQRSALDGMRLDILFGKKDYDAAYKLAEKFSSANKDNAGLQNELAWRMVTDEKIEKRNLDVAETIARRAVDASQGEDAAILDTLARVRFMQGKKDEAITLQEKAVKLASTDQEDQLKATLESYKKGELPKAD